jgi:hypothetical protein
MGYETEPKYLVVGFMGYNSKLTNDLFKWFCDNNREEIVESRFGNWDSFAIFNDGTKVIPIRSSQNQRGLKIDQLILCDDERWEIYRKRYDDISLTRLTSMSITNVPDEFQILECLYDKGIDE